MGRHKHIERTIGNYISGRYHRVAEIGIGQNFDAASLIKDAGAEIFCTDIRSVKAPPGIRILNDDVFDPDIYLYQGLDLIYSIRPGEEMIPAMIALAARVDCDLLVYHLGFEGYGSGGEIVDCGVILHRYYKNQNPSNSVF